MNERRVLMVLLALAVAGVIWLAMLSQADHAGGEEEPDRGTEVTAQPEDTTTTTTTQAPRPVPMPCCRPVIVPPTTAVCVKPMARLLYPELCKAEIIPPLVIERELPETEPVVADPSYTG